jgi:hypothetical protein
MRAGRGHARSTPAPARRRGQAVHRDQQAQESGVEGIERQRLRQHIDDGQDVGLRLIIPCDVQRRPGACPVVCFAKTQPFGMRLGPVVERAARRMSPAAPIRSAMLQTIVHSFMINSIMRLACAQPSGERQDAVASYPCVKAACRCIHGPAAACLRA